MNDEAHEQITFSLNGIIWVSLWAPKGDPSPEQLAAATVAFKLLEQLGLDVRGRDDVVEVLTGSNGSFTNFLLEDGHLDHPDIAAFDRRLDEYQQELAEREAAKQRRPARVLVRMANKVVSRSK